MVLCGTKRGSSMALVSMDTFKTFLKNIICHTFIDFFVYARYKQQCVSPKIDHNTINNDWFTMKV